MEYPHCKVVFGRKFCPVKIGPKIQEFFLNKGNVRFVFSNHEKAHPLTYFA